MLEMIVGRETEPLAADELARRCAEHDAVLIDVGCGDGAFPYRLAGDSPDLFCVGVDPNREAMAEYSRRARRKPARGGRANVLYLAAALESMPPELDGRADVVTINFPWAGLREHVLNGDATLSAALSRLAAPVALLQILINADVEGESALDPESLRAALRSPLAAVGFTLETVDWLPAEAGPRSRWAGRLIRGSGRRVLLVRAQRGDVASSVVATLDRALRLPAGELDGD